MDSAKHKHYTVSHLKGPPFIGMLRPALKDPIGFMMDISRNHGDIICFEVMGKQAIHLNHPDLIQHVLVDNHKNYRKSRPYIRFESAIGNGLLTSNGDKWKRDRQKIQPLFNRNWIAGYHFEIARAVGEKYRQKWRHLTENGPAELDITAEMADITIEIILRAIFGKNIDDETVSSLHHSYNVMMEYVRNLRFIPEVDLRKLFHLPVYYAFKKELDNVDERIRALCAKYRSNNSDPNNMLALLIEAQKVDPQNFSEKDIADHAKTMVFAGFESTSILLQWIWYILDERADIKMRLRENIKANLSAPLTYDDLGKMDYLAAVIKDTLRMYPSFWMTGREPLEDDYFGDFKVKKGVSVALSPFSMHRHPRFWEQPDVCIPERFLNGNEEKIPDGAYFPFSQGPRKCSGFSFAEMEAKTIMATLLPGFEVKALNKENNPLFAGVSLKLKYPLIARISRA